MKKLIFLVLLISFNVQVIAAESSSDAMIKLNIPYYSKAEYKNDSYMRERAILDVHCPKNKTNLPVIVWIHGGGLWKGNKYIPNAYKGKDVCVVAVSYRLSPKVKYPKYIEDAAAAVAWTFNHIEEYGGNANQIFVSGHSAGGYLTGMISMDKTWLNAHNIDANRIAGIILLSSKLSTLSIVRDETTISDEASINDETIASFAPMVIDKKAPLYYVRADAPPLFLMTGDRKLDLPGNYEENALFARLIKNAGHDDVTLHELGGYGHQITVAAFPLVLEEMKRVLDNRKHAPSL